MSKKYFNLVKILKYFFRIFGVNIIREHNYQNLIKAKKKFPLIVNLQKRKFENFINIIKKSKSELNQELFAILENNFQKNGFFVEFGATNGLCASNSYLLEKYFLWKGILCEPAKVYHAQLIKNRKCNIEYGCVWGQSNKRINFIETQIPSYSTIKTFVDSDMHKEMRKNSKEYEVITISLTDLLKKYNAPKVINYLSIDTEGSEFEILKNFDFNSYKFNFITYEHNYNYFIRSKVRNLLTKNGYKIKYDGFSEYEDWFVKI